MEEIQVSIIIPSFNEANTIHRSILSLKNQTHSFFEAIIIDDGSTDNTRHIIEELIKGDNRFKYYYIKNSGVSHARNYAMKVAKGNYVSFLDADDSYSRNFIEKMLNKMITVNGDVCYCGYRIINDGIDTKVRTKFTNKNVLRQYLSYRVKVPTTGWMIKKSLIDKYDLKFRENISWGEDTEFFTKILGNAKSICYVKNYLVNYYKDNNENNLSNFSINKIDDDYELFLRLLNDDVIIKDKKSKKILTFYRIQGQIVYRLLESFNNQIDNSQILFFYSKYEKILEDDKLVNGLKSIKLFYSKNILKKKIATIKHE